MSSYTHFSRFTAKFAKEPQRTQSNNSEFPKVPTLRPLRGLSLRTLRFIDSKAEKFRYFFFTAGYIWGRNCFFIVLDGNKYAVSNAYNAADYDIFQIFAILQKSREIIQRFI